MFPVPVKVLAVPVKVLAVSIPTLSPPVTQFDLRFLSFSSCRDHSGPAETAKASIANLHLLFLQFSICKLNFKELKSC